MAEVQFHAQSRQTNRPEQKKKGFEGRKELVIKTIVLGKVRASILAPDDIKVEEWTERAMLENGGGIAKQWDSKLGKWWVVAMIVDGECLAKEGLREDDKNIEWKMSDKDKKIVIEHSKKSKGGPEFTIGENGVPVVVKGNELIFPSGDEMKTQGITELYYKEVNSTVDPGTPADFLKASKKEQMEGCHASTREKDVEVNGYELQVGDKETGEIMPIGEYQKIESFVYDDINLENVMKHELKFMENRVSPVLFHNEAVQFSSTCEVSYLHIKIIESKENIFDHVEFISNLPETSISVIPIASPGSAVSQTSDNGTVNSNPMHETSFEQPNYEMNRNADVVKMPISSGYNKIQLPEQNRKEINEQKNPKVEKRKKEKLVFLPYRPKAEKTHIIEKPVKEDNFRYRLPKTDFSKIELPKQKHKRQATKLPKIKTTKPKPKKRKRKKKGAKEKIKKIIKKTRRTVLKIKELLKNKRKKQIHKKAIIQKTGKKIHGRKKIPKPKITKKKQKKKNSKIRKKPEIRLQSEKKARTGKNKPNKKSKIKKKPDRKRKKMIKYLLTGYF